MCNSYENAYEQFFWKIPILMYAIHVRMHIVDLIFGIGLPILNVRSFLDTNVDWIWFYEDANKVNFCFERLMEF